MTDLPVSALRYAAFLLATLPRLAALPALRRGRFRVLDAAQRAALGQPGLGLEFGVWKGASMRRMARREPGRLFHGFDSLVGFPEDGRRDWQQDFAVPAPPRFPDNARFHAGWFDETVPPFAAALTTPVALINLDCDIHSSAWTVLEAMGADLRPGLVLHLDEALNYDTWLWNEMLALFQCLEATGLGIDWVARGGAVRDLPQTLRFLEQARYPNWADDVAAGFARQAACVLTPHNADLDPLRDSTFHARAEDLGQRLEQRYAAHIAGTQQRQDCHPHDPDAQPPPRPRAWRRYLSRLLGVGGIGGIGMR